MNTRLFARLGQWAPLVLLPAALLSGCGGSTDSSSVEQPAVSALPASATVGLLFTDEPTDEFSAIKLDVVAAVLIGDDDGQQTIFDGLEPVDLLDLENFNEPVIFGEVEPGTFTKLRLIIDNLELVPKDGGDSIFPALPANGKIDLLDADGFTVLPGRALLIEVDMDANKSIKITSAGNSGKYNFRPVVKVKFTDDGPLDKLARVEGTVAEIPLDPAGNFLVCDNETPDSCINVATGDGTSIFNDMGLPADFTLLTVGTPVTVIGRYEVTEDMLLNALVVEVGGNAEQVKGNVVSTPANDRFLLLGEDNNDLVVELQIGTKFFNAEGEIGAGGIVIGSDVEVEGVRPEKADADDPDLIRAALVFVEAPEDDQLSGTIQSISTTGPAFDLIDADANTFTVSVADDADIVLVNASAAEVTIGGFDSLAVDQVVDVFGTLPAGGIFEANEIIVAVTDTE